MYIGNLFGLCTATILDTQSVGVSTFCIICLDSIVPRVTLCYSFNVKVFFLVDALEVDHTHLA